MAARHRVAAKYFFEFYEKMENENITGNIIHEFDFTGYYTFLLPTEQLERIFPRPRNLKPRILSKIKEEKNG